jgi:hypothetical protein
MKLKTEIVRLEPAAEKALTEQSMPGPPL